MKRLLILGFIIAGTSNAGTHNLTQKDKQFSESTLTIKAGDTIVFMNEDTTAHSVFSTSPGNSFNLKIQKPKTSNEQVFSTPGEVDVRCAIHPKMQVKIKVEK